MCGISGIVRLSEAGLPPPEMVRRMAAAIAHRGPDEFGEYRDDFIHLTAVRLAILDIENGQQPAFNETGDCVAVYNGELYNYREIAKSLEAKGHQLVSTGDTAVLPHLYEEKGEGLMADLRGMYGFAIWDKVRKGLLLARDRLGIKPLFYAVTGDYLLFSSEIKGILASGLVSRELDLDSVDDLFSLSYPFPPRTMFREVRELLPAHTLKVEALRRDSVRKSRYWRAPFSEPKHRGSEAALCEEFLDRLSKVVEDHMISEVKLGTYLSGGVDSSTVTALARKAAGISLETFTISFPGHALDEAEQARSTAEQLGVKLNLVPCGENMADGFLRSVFHTELPLQYPLASSFIILSEAARAAGVKVILTGEGADEQLAGYECFRLEKIRSWLRKFPMIRKPLYRRIFSWLDSPKGLAEFLHMMHESPDAPVRESFKGVRPPWFDIWHGLELGRGELFAERLARPIAQPPEGYDDFARADYSTLGPLDAALAFELETRLPGWTVLIDDRAAMANGVETRVPFLDHTLVEWITKLPENFKLRGLKDKYILRESVSGIIPKKISTRAKRPFYSPIREVYFSENRPEFVDELLSESSLRRAGIFAPDTVRTLDHRLCAVEHNSFERLQLEWMMALILGTQALDAIFRGDIMRYQRQSPKWPVAKPTR
jgi:asparagine synthase (glutamine-hydrolysing)